MLTLTDDQERAVQRMLANTSGGHLIGSEIGAGKTVVSVEYALRTGARRVLVICPLGTRIGWERTFRGQGWIAPVRRIENSNKTGRAVKAAYLAGEPGVFLIGHALFRREKSTWENAPQSDIVIYDEIQDASNRRSLGFKIIKKVNAPQKIAMSGTWFGNKFENAWAPCRWLWPQTPGQNVSGHLVDTSFHRWKAQWCELAYDPFSYDHNKVEGEKVPGKWNAQLPLYIRVESKLDVQAVPEDLFVELSPKQRKMYDELEHDALTWLGEHPLVADLPITARIRMRQATLGELSLDGEDVVFALDCKSSKLDALIEFLEDHDEPVLIYTDSKRFAKVVAARVKDSRLWDGDTPQEVREDYLRDFGHTFTRLIATIGAMGPGIDGLQYVCHTVVWLSQTEDNNLNNQALGRLVRKGQASNVLNVYIKAIDTLDEAVYGRLLATELANRASLGRTA